MGNVKIRFLFGSSFVFWAKAVILYCFFSYGEYRYIVRATLLYSGNTGPLFFTL